LQEVWDKYGDLNFSPSKYGKCGDFFSFVGTFFLLPSGISPKIYIGSKGK
jgi:hypothetical protein